MGGVRNILWQHLWQVGHGQGVPPPGLDPTLIVPADDFCDALLQHADRQDLQEAGREYVRLWASTFRTLIRHLRGRPDRMLALFVEEFYPYLRGVRAAARVQGQSRRHAQVVLDDDLPGAYVEGLLEAFIGLAGSPCQVAQIAPGVYDIRMEPSARDHLVQVARLLAHLRIPLLLAAALAATYGVAASALIGPAGPVSVAAVIAGAVAAQSAANALQDVLYAKPHHALGPPTPTRAWLWFQLSGSALLAAAALTWLARQQVSVLVYAGLGLLVAVQYARLQSAGLGPLSAWVTHGVLIPLGAVAALHGSDFLATPAPVLLFTLPPGMLVAALVHLDDLADRPLDEAGGRRTLVVRLPRRRQVTALITFFALGLGAATLIAALLAPVAGLICLGLGLGTVPLVRRVADHIDDPPSLAAPRVAALALLVATTTTLAFTFLVSP